MLPIDLSKRVLRGLLLPLLLPLLLLNTMASASADEVAKPSFIPLLADKPYLHVIHQGRSVKVQRVQDPEYQLQGYFAKTARQCPPFCIQPMQPVPGVQVIGEAELFAFMERQLRDGSGLLIDARTPSWHAKGTIPGSVNLPFTQLFKAPNSPVLAAVFKQLGVTPREPPDLWDELTDTLGFADQAGLSPKWDFRQAKDLVIWCNGPSCQQSPRAIRGLVAAGYPKHKILYYRGGMQMWQTWGLTTVIPE